MAFLFQSTPKVIPEFTGLQVNTAVQVLPIPIIYGSPRVNVNLVYYNGFNSQQVSASSGKGVLSGGKGGTNTEYFATLIMAIGEGPISGISVIYQDQAVYTPADFPTNGAFFFSGSATQTPWSYIVSNWPSDARSYKDTCYYGFSNAQLDSSATVPQINLVPQGIFSGSSPLNNDTIAITTGQYDQNGNPISFIGNLPLGDADADPGLCTYDMLTNTTYGAGFPAAFVDTSTLFTSPQGFDPNTGDQALSTYCQAVGFGWSFVLNNAETMNSILDRLMNNMTVAVVWTGAQLRFIPYWDSFASGNPGYDASNPQGIGLKYYAPYSQPIVQLTYNQILQAENQADDPITFARKDPMTVYNKVRLDFRDRHNFFNDVPATAEDEAHAELYGPRVDNIGLANEFSLGVYANLAAQIRLRRNISILNTYTFKLGPLWAWLDPMDILLIPDPVNFLGTPILVRVVSVEDDENDDVVITAEEYPIGAQSPTVIPIANTTPPNQGPTNVAAAPVAPPVIFEPTSAMLTATGKSTGQIIIGASGELNGVLDPYWGGYNIYVSLDNVKYEEVGVQNGPSTIGVTTAAISASSTSITVNLRESGGTLGSPGAGPAALGKSICVLKDVSGFELITYATATLTGPNTYLLTGVLRGQFGTTARSFGGGTEFLYVGTDGNFFEAGLPPQYIGATLYIKLQSFNTYRNYTQPIASCTVYQYTPAGTTPVGPVAPTTMQPYGRRRSVVNSAAIVDSRRKRSGGVI